MKNTDRIALVTGANSGLGFEAAAQLAEAGWKKIILACRSEEKAESAATQLAERTGKHTFDTLIIDTSEINSAHGAAKQLQEAADRIDFLLLNAGASRKDPQFNSDKVEITYASTLIGHHVLTMRMIEHGLLSPQARIVIAGSEGARGNMPGMPVHDIRQIAVNNYNGDLVATIEALCQLKAPMQNKFNNMQEYVTAKLVVAWWAAALSRKLPAGMTANAVSPGAAVSTSFGRDANIAMRLLMMPILKLLGPLLSMNGSVENAAKRYLDAADFPDNETGHFYATAHRKKLVGPMGKQTWPDYFIDKHAQEAGFDAMVSLTGIGYPSQVNSG